jgi:hypothetical protein
MGERAKKKRAEESRARKAKKPTEQVSQLEEIPASTDRSRSNAGNSKKHVQHPHLQPVNLPACLALLRNWNLVENIHQ